MMIEISFKTDTAGQGKARHCYRVAQQPIVIDQPVAALHAFEDECAEDSLGSVAAVSLINRDPLQLIYHGPGWLGNEWREVKCWTVEGGYKIAVAGAACNWLTADGRSIFIDPEAGAAEEVVVEIALGPPLILALALRDIWCLHGSALIAGDRALLFLGESGKGKSTLARWLDKNSTQALRRIGDDILPVALYDDALHTLPHFPQLKISAAHQPSLGMRERLPVAAAYVLARPNTPDRIEINKLETQQGALAFVRHTVASRLFDPALMAKHFDFCVRAASQVRINELSYPLKMEILPEIERRLMLDRESSSTR